MGQLRVKLLEANVGHKRLWPKVNMFNYKVFYTIAPVSKERIQKPKLFSFNRWNVLSMHRKDHGIRSNDSDWYEFIIQQLRAAKIKIKKDYKLYLVAHPRIFGYAFNPISYWLVTDPDDNLRAVLCEVHNTFKQTHNYLLHKDNGDIMNEADTFFADKKLYVSPFNKIEGHYEFKFSYQKNKFKSIIDYYDKSGQHIINTYMGGEIEELNNKRIAHLLFSYPFMTFMVVVRIHWQALKLYIKKVGNTLGYKPRKYKNNQTSIGKNK